MDKFIKITVQTGETVRIIYAKETAAVSMTGIMFENKPFIKVEDKDSREYLINVNSIIMVEEFNEPAPASVAPKGRKEEILEKYGIDISTPPKYDGVGGGKIACPYTAEDLERASHAKYGVERLLAFENID